MSALRHASSEQDVDTPESAGLYNAKLLSSAPEPHVYASTLMNRFQMNDQVCYSPELSEVLTQRVCAETAAAVAKTKHA